MSTQNDGTMLRINSVKYLGVIMNLSLPWKKHLIGWMIFGRITRAKETTATAALGTLVGIEPLHITLKTEAAKT